jgi:hypothetical protein
VGNLPCTLGQALETGSNTGYDLPPHGGGCKAPAVQDEPAAYQLVGGVMAYQGDDG